MRRTVLIATPVIAILWFPFTAKAQQPPYQATIDVRISSSGQEAEITSYVTRELRSLQGVTVSSTNPTWVVDIVALQVMSRGGDDVGWALSVVITQPLGEGLLGVYANYLPESSRESFLGLASASFASRHWLRTGGTDDLRRIAEGIVASFDGEILEPARRRWDELWRSIDDNAQ